ncbi:putative dehydrogenase [Hydrogenispora ethanolica]|uniref:Putative dehydrogenase n=1 Tax=Hydrogenispora ethanolica TaxID=1082276 RepID=A0A4R1RTJ3_HYDET|nr:Gfo/Idh/MocA family oxidoreductase [Hydrogenispora ethanolica]TCL69390.1 putative dehydrogenase [Hydrogenispora ethanolica]
MQKVRVGLIGSGFVAAIHLEALRKVSGLDVQVVACASPRKAELFASQHGIPQAFSDYRIMLDQVELDVIDICTPNHLHKQMILDVAAAGKDVICEKPLTGYFSQPGDGEPIGETVDRQQMFLKVWADMAEIREAVGRAGVLFMYAENWIYAPPIVKARRILSSIENTTILSQRAEESHSGSHASYARQWSLAGGGSLLRLGSHPMAAVIHLKHFDGQQKNGQPIRVKSIVAETGKFTDIPGVAQAGTGWVTHGFTDVEDWATATLTFTDGTKAIVVSSDTILGGVRNLHEIFHVKGVIQCNMNPNSDLMLYTPGHEVIGSEYIAEKLETSGGWQFAAPDEDWIRGYHHEMQDFMECVASRREPLSGLELACETTEAIYAAYLAAASGTRVELR